MAQFRYLLMLPAVCVLAACSAPADSNAEQLHTGPVRTPSEGERAAARELSLGMSSSLQQTTEPYQRALQCRIAIDQVRQAIRESGALNEEQLRLIRTVRDNYVREALELGKQAGKSSAEIDADLASARESILSSSRGGAIALACIQHGNTSNG